MKKTLTLLEGYHKVKAVSPYKGLHIFPEKKYRYAYKLYVDNKPISGLWVVSKVDGTSGLKIYKRLKKVI